MTASLAHSLRLQRIYRHGGCPILVVPLDHPVTTGPIGPIDELLDEIAGNGADAVVLHKGALRQVRPQLLRDTGLIVHLSAGTIHAPDPHERCVVGTVEEAVRLGADGVSVQVNLGSTQESRQLADLAGVAAACQQWGMPLLAMVYPRGPRIPDPPPAALVAHAVTLAAQLGADLVKTTTPGDPTALAGITRGCPIPVLVAGGAYDGDEGATMARVHDAMLAGAGGVAVGRGIFASPDPGAMTRKIADLIHGRHEHMSGGLS